MGKEDDKKELAGRNRNLIKNTLIFAIGNLGSKVLTFILVPIYTHYLPTEEMGVYDIILTTAAVLTPVLILQISDGAYRWLIDDFENKKSVICSGQLILVVNTIAMCIVIYFLKAFVKVEMCFALLLITTCFYTYYKEVVRGLGNNSLYSVSGMLYTAINLILNSIFLIELNMGVYALIYSQILSNCIITTILCFFVFKLNLLSLCTIDIKICRDLLKYSIPFVPNVICWWIINLTDRYFIKFYCGNGAVGIYAISNKFPTLITTIAGFFLMSWQEAAIKEYKQSDKDKKLSETFEKFYIISFLLITILLPITRTMIGGFIESSYYDSWKYIGVLYVGAIFNGFSAFLGAGYYSSKKTSGAMLTTGIGAITNLLINIIYIKRFGLWAAAFSTMFSNIVLFIIRLITLDKYYKIELNKFKFLKCCMLVMIYLLLALQENYKIDVLCIIMGIVIFIVFEKKDLQLILKEQFKRRN